tara:strand:+ start:354 stop:566 length:213 start_codon:yes stop_codon:yes gene_type:complete
MKLKEYYYEWNPYTEEVTMSTEKLKELVRFYKEEYRNAKTDDERQRAMWNLNSYQTELMMRGEEINVRLF